MSKANIQSKTYLLRTTSDQPDTVILPNKWKRDSTVHKWPTTDGSEIS